MTGPEHYRQAEERLRMAWEDDRHPDNVVHLVAEAQVHATLALAAAVATLDAHEGPGGGSSLGRTLTDVNEWERVLAPEVGAR